MAIKLETSPGNFTVYAGLVCYANLFDKLNFRDMLKGVLPRPKDSQKLFQRNCDKFRSMVLGFVAGAECLDDMPNLSKDPGFRALCREKKFNSATYGNFLRSFKKEDIFHLNESLIKSALKLRLNRFKNDQDFILDIDSTNHVQSGKKMEGLAFNHKNNWGLDSLQAFDQYGFQYWMEVRPGNTFTSVNASTVIESVFHRVPRKMNRYLRADSGYCNFDVFKACNDRKIGFVIAMRANMLEPVLSKIHPSAWKKAKALTFRDGRACEIASSVYYSSHSKASCYRVVVIRAKKIQRELFGDGYDYHAWVTNIGEHQKQNEKLVLFYQKRGNAENFIRELKNGFDMKHFPCLKLSANKVYGILAAIAYNLMRFTAWEINKNHPSFSKNIRLKMVYIAAQVVKKARYTIFRLNYDFKKEVYQRINMIQHIKFGFG